MRSTNRDQRLAELIERLTAESREGRSPDVEAAARENPDLADELRQLWMTAQIAEDLGRAEHDSLGPTVVVGSSSSSALLPAMPGELPARVGDYELLEEIGRGGMGVVFRARQVSLDRIVALKMILREGLASASDVERFRAEAESAAKLNHPHIVPVYEVGQGDGLSYFSMKYVEGTTLARRLADGPLNPRQAARLLAPVAGAIASAHRAGVLHRDLKPSNILIDSEGRPYVTDFGLAKRVPTDSDEDEKDAAATHSRSLTAAGAILGTPGYMAPEQAAGRRSKTGFAADIYSLGAILYAMLTGRAPFQAASPVDTVMMVLEQDPLPPRLLNRRADPDLEMIALKCLQKPPELRYQSADDLAADLNSYLAGEPISARSSRFAQVVTRAFRETHHAAVLENWGLLWMWHSLALVILCFVTNAFQWRGIVARWPYLILWGAGLGVWAAIFWNLRRRAGPVTFVERQIAHLWAGSVVSSTGLFFIEWLLGLAVLTLSPALGLVSGMVFLAKAGILSGVFYIQAVALFLTAAVMAWLPQASRAAGLPDVAISFFGFVSAACFFFPGLKYYRQSARPT